MLLSCEQAPPGTSSPSGEPAVRSAVTAAGSAAPTASSSRPAVHLSGPCAGQAPGDHACDGRKLVRCGDRPGIIDKVRDCYSIERCDAGRATCVPSCPEGEVYVPPTGPEGFTMGRGYLEGADDSRSWQQNKGHMGNTDQPHTVVITKPFCLDQYEITVREWMACMEQKICPRPDPAHRFVTYDHKQLDHPINAVDWRATKKFCELHGKTLPTEAQWEWAATHGDGRTYPWGNEPASCTRADYTPGPLDHPAGDAGCHRGGPSKVGAHPAGAIEWPDGKIYDLAGNVWEWCLDSYLAYKPEKAVDPLVWTHEGGAHALRGGGWNRSHLGIRAAFRGAGRVDYRVPGLGARCARNPAEAPIVVPPPASR